MVFQNLIKRTLSQSESIECICHVIADNDGLHRTELADRICERFGFRDPNGRLQRSGCLKALRKLEEQGHFALPAPRCETGPKKPKRLANPLAPIEGLPGEVNEVQGLRLVLVEGEQHMRVWNEMMASDHPRGAGPLAGRQVRYLVDSEHGWLGGLGFAAPALNLAARDEWIGWSFKQREDNLHRVVGLARLLIRCEVRCRNLASRILSLAIDALPADFKKRYGYEPYLVESFVDTEHYSGTCYQAANWRMIGRTKGRGRQDCHREAPETVKDIYVHVLRKDFRKKMALPAHAGLEKLGPSQGVEGGDWARKEFENAPLGDARLSDRLALFAQMKGEKPSQSVTEVFGGEWAKVKGHYRMIDKPEDSAVNMSNILLPHRKRTIRRMMSQRTVLAVQDGSDINYNNLDKCEGLGEIGSNQTGAKSRGLHLHSTLAVSTTGLPLGVLKAQCTAPTTRGDDDKRPSHTIPIEEKDTYCWIEHLRDTMEAAAQMPGTRIVNVCDREADIFELFDEQRKNPCAELLVRAKHNRKTTDEAGCLFDSIKETPLKKIVEVPIERKSARPKKSKQKERPKQEGRIGKLSLRYMPARIDPPSYHANKEPVNLWLIHAVEENPPEGVKPVEWFLLTTIEIDSVEKAEECLRWYSLRWRIEDWHRVLKTGCRIEDLAHETAERLRRSIAINMVVAWRIMLMTLLGRESPELPPEILFSDVELEVLEQFAQKKTTNKLPTTLGAAVYLVAKLGGYLGRKCDPPPGHQIMWRGYRNLSQLCEGYQL